MLDIDLYSDTRLEVVVDTYNSNFRDIVTVLGSLLNAKYHKGYWTISFFDFYEFKKKLDKLNLNGDRTITKEASKALDQFGDQLDAVDGLKTGIYNGEIESIEFSTNPYIDQYTGINFLTSRQSAGIFDECGIGKSLQILYASKILIDKGEVKNTLVFCPNSVKSTWQNEIQKHTDYSFTVIPNGTKEVLESIDFYKIESTQFLICHFDCLGVSKKITAESSRGKEYKKQVYPVLEAMLELDFDQVVIDEAHQLKNEDAKRTQAVFEIVENLRKKKEGFRVVLATGTPVSESPMDGRAALRFLAPDLVPAKNKFQKHFIVMKDRKSRDGRRFWREVVGYKNLRELKELIESVSIRRLKSDIRGMPEKVFQKRDVFLIGAQRTLYNAVKKDIYKELSKKPSKKLAVKTVMEKTIRLRQILNHPEIVEEKGKSAKYAELDLVLEEVLADSSSKVVIWTEFVTAVELLHERYANKYGAVKLYGKTSSEELADLSQTFDECDEQVVIAIPKKGGTGIDFLSRARTAIYVEKPYSLIEYRQSIDRIHRRAKEEPKTEVDRIKASPATVIFLEVADSIDQMVTDILKRKEDVSDAITISDEKLVEMNKVDVLKYLRS